MSSEELTGNVQILCNDRSGALEDLFSLPQSDEAENLTRGAVTDRQVISQSGTLRKEVGVL